MYNVLIITENIRDLSGGHQLKPSGGGNIFLAKLN